MVVVALFFAWRPQLEFNFRFDDYPLLREAQEGPSLDHLRNHALAYFDVGNGEPAWQPGLHEVADLAGTVMHGEARGWMAAALILHAVLTLVLFMVLVAEGAGEWLAAAGALVFGLAPAGAEVVASPSLAFAVLPSLLFVLWSGRAVLQWLQGARGAWIVAALLLLAYALAFDGSGVVVPLLVFGGAFAVGSTRERGSAALLIGSLLLAAPAAAHLLHATRGAGAELPPFSFVARLVPGAFAARDGVASLVGVASDPGWVAGAIALLWFGLLVTGSARTRFFLVWALLAVALPIPQLVRPGAPPWTLSVLMPFVVGVVLWCQDRVGRHGKTMKLVAFLPLAALAGFHAMQLQPALETARVPGERAVGALDSLQHTDLNGVISIAVDGAPPRMAEGLGVMVAMFVPSAGGAKPVVADLGLVRRPPLLFHLGSDFGANDTGVGCFQWDEAARRLARTTSEALIGGLTPQPRFALRFEADVEPDHAAAQRRIAASPRDLYRFVILDAPPAPPFTPTTGGHGTVKLLTTPEGELIEMVADAPVDGFLVLHQALASGRAEGGETKGPQAWLDGLSAPLLRADVSGYALRVPTGRHLVQVARAR